ncbi:TIGR01440 family protein [Aneurinibacillus uraniidurans]|uniref:TIGR01440 family protein n=1 Tax=Aneurinibacillus uraniidurans TaxID=2966586 RepID=UPI00234B9A1E|nr:TIGR01440 family protein [Aneurinibacillus sp. B1]WCN39654.1 TIGR01440 family protein [Aneurinibacillus sp. B1]
MSVETIREEVATIAFELLQAKPLGVGCVLVIGTSTSEIIGRRIGSAGSQEVAVALYEALEAVRVKHGFALAFQCCEHLNRALVIERETAERFGWPEVTVIPVPTAGGAMAAHAFRAMQDAVVVESIQADAGIDIGDTFIGMHLKPVAVPVRPSVKQVGEAHVTMAVTRPKLIGGVRAVYDRGPLNDSCR